MKFRLKHVQSHLLAVHPLAILLFAAMLLAGPGSRAEEGESTVDLQPAQEEKELTQHEKFRRFEQEMSGVALVGQFTIQGREQDELPKERYEIRSVRKMPTGDVWLFTARIKYGSHDVTLPLPLDVKWAGNTPVITMDNVTIPVLGTFSCRVVLDRDKYAGTWSHDDVGGHMFGVIEKPVPPADESN
jgi:hypothetical protein